MKRSFPPYCEPVRRTDIVFPEYRYVPGRSPHPIRHPKGHMYQQERHWEPGQTWGSDLQFLYATDLFDHGYYWEAHEQWEACWKRAQGKERLCIQGLIKISASILKHHMGHFSARDLLFQSALQLLSCREEIGWNIASLIEATRACFQGKGRPCLPMHVPNI